MCCPAVPSVELRVIDRLRCNRDRQSTSSYVLPWAGPAAGALALISIMESM